MLQEVVQSLQHFSAQPSDGADTWPGLEQHPLKMGLAEAPGILKKKLAQATKIIKSRNPEENILEAQGNEKIPEIICIEGKGHG